MKDFKINRNSWHYKLNKKFMNEDGVTDHRMQMYWEPKVNNFCAYWRATLFRAIFAVFLLAVIITIVCGVGVLVIANPVKALLIVASGVGWVAALIGIVFLVVTGDKAKKRFEESDGLVATKIKTYKAKICPGVIYEEK